MIRLDPVIDEWMDPWWLGGHQMGGFRGYPTGIIRVAGSAKEDHLPGSNPRTRLATLHAEGSSVGHVSSAKESIPSALDTLEENRMEAYIWMSSK